VLLTTPTTPAERTKEIAEASQGFIYLVSVNGVTGPRATVDPRVKDRLREIKQVCINILKFMLKNFYYHTYVLIGFPLSAGHRQSSGCRLWHIDT
jgi:hypothetical protein